MSLQEIFSTKLTANDSTAQEQLGAIRYEYSSTDSCMKKYMYIKYEAGTADVAAAKGDVLLWSGTTGYTVTKDESDEEDNMFAGVAIGTITDAYYAWIQVGGFCNKVFTDAGVSAHDALVPHTTDGEADTMAAGEEDHVFGVALADDTTTSPHYCADVMLKNN